MIKKIKILPSFKLLDILAILTLCAWMFDPLAILSLVYINVPHPDSEIQSIFSASIFTFLAWLFTILSVFVAWVAIKNLYKKNYNFNLFKNHFNVDTKVLIIVYCFLPIANYFLLKKIATNEMYSHNAASEKFPGFIHFSRKPVNPITISLVILTIFVILTWYINVVHGPISIPGFFDIIKAPIVGFVGNSQLIVYLIAISCFAVTLDKIKILDKFFSKIFIKFRNKEIIILPFVILLFMLLGSINHTSDELMGMYPLVAVIMIGAGFDTIVALFSIYLATTAGIVVATIDPFAIVIGFTSAGGNMSDGIIWRFISLFVVYGIVTAYVMWYANRVRKNPTKSIIYSEYAKLKATFGTVPSTTPLNAKDISCLTIFGLTFVALFIGVVRWDTLIGFHGFIDFQNWLAANIPYFSSNIGDASQVALGTWSIETLPVLFLISTIAMLIIFKTPIDEMVDVLLASWRGCARLAITFAIIGGFQEIIIDSGLSHVMADQINALAYLNQTFAIVCLFLFFFLFAFVMPSCSSGARMLFPIIGQPLMDHGILPSAISAYAAGAGLNCMIMPTNGSFLVASNIFGIPLNKSYKAIMPIFFIIFAAMLCLLVAGTFIPFAKQS